MLIKCAFLCLIKFISCQQRQMEAFIVQGKEATIEHHPHSVFMSASCSKGAINTHWRCGSSILNQQILLTAAHCLACKNTPQAIFSVGSSNVKGTFVTSAIKFIVHPNYRDRAQSYDIALVKIKSPLPLSQKVSRVALMRYPPYNEQATVAGWGLIDEMLHTASNNLRFIRQKVLSQNECISILGRIPIGCLCATSKHRNSYASMGDSGGALVVRGFIQVGIVAFKKPERSTVVTAYTDTGYFYEWILETSKSLFCQ